MPPTPARGEGIRGKLETSAPLMPRHEPGCDTDQKNGLRSAEGGFVMNHEGQPPSNEANFISGPYEQGRPHPAEVLRTSRGAGPVIILG